MKLAFTRPSFSSYLLGAAAMLVLAGVVDWIVISALMGWP